MRKALIGLVVLGLCEATWSASAPQPLSRQTRSRRPPPTPQPATNPDAIAREHNATHQRAKLEPVERGPASYRRRAFFSGWDAQLAAGLNAGYAQTNGSQNGTTRNALAFELMFEKKLNDTFYFCPELAYVQRGVQTTLLNLPGVNVAGLVSFDYLELPLLMKAKLWLVPPRWRIFFVAGPDVGLLLSRQINVLGVNLDLTNHFNQADVLLVLGTGIEYRISPALAVAGHLRYNMGLVDIDSTSSTFYTRAIQLLFGLQFRI